MNFKLDLPSGELVDRFDNLILDIQALQQQWRKGCFPRNYQRSTEIEEAVEWTLGVMHRSVHSSVMDQVEDQWRDYDWRI